MAGMLPGVECARRRRFHQSGGHFEHPSISGHGSTRRSSFCLYTSKHESHLHSNASTQQPRNPLRQAYLDEELDETVREAKERLDERLKLGGGGQSKLQSKRALNGQQGSRNWEGRPMGQGDTQTEVFRLKKRFMNWAKLSWKSSEQEECAVCLEQFKIGQTLMQLPCAHRFHLKCLSPWLQSNAHCPCCRMEILN